MKQFGIVRKLKDKSICYIDTLKEDEVYSEYLKKSKEMFYWWRFIFNWVWSKIFNLYTKRRWYKDKIKKKRLGRAIRT